MWPPIVRWTLRAGLGSMILLTLPLIPLAVTDFAAVQAAESLDQNTATEDQLKGLPSKDPIGFPFDFRKTSWGMTKEQVMKAETGKLEAEKDDRLGYSDSVAGKEVLIVYVFTKTNCLGPRMYSGSSIRTKIYSLMIMRRLSGFRPTNMVRLAKMAHVGKMICIEMTHKTGGWQ